MDQKTLELAQAAATSALTTVITGMALHNAGQISEQQLQQVCEQVIQHTHSVNSQWDELRSGGTPPVA